MLLKAFFMVILLVGISAKDALEDDSTFENKLDSSCDSPLGCMGSSDTVNYTAIEEFINKKIDSRMSANEMYTALILANLRSELRGVTNCFGVGIVYENTCFFLIIDESPRLRIDYFDAKALCQAAGATLGNIYSQIHFNRIVRNVRSRRLDSPFTYINFWTGMKRDIPSGKVYLSDGTPAPYVEKVRNSYEWTTLYQQHQYVYVSVWTDGGSHGYNPGGFGNTHAAQTWNAALCQYPIPTDVF